MSFTKDAVNITGGCNCKAVRYQISVPPFTERPMSPYKTPGANVGDLRIPCVLLCHCSSCRLGSNQVLPIGVICEQRTVEVGMLPRSNDNQGALEMADDQRQYSCGTETFDHRTIASKDGHLAVYKSSPHSSRWFCNRCGTSIGYSMDPGVIPDEWGWPTLVSIWSGTIDREHLDKDYMAPERMVWCYDGVPWIRKLAAEGAGGIPEHPLTKIDKVVGDDIEQDLEELRHLSGKFPSET